MAIGSANEGVAEVCQLALDSCDAIRIRRNRDIADAMFFSKLHQLFIRIIRVNRVAATTRAKKELLPYIVKIGEMVSFYVFLQFVFGSQESQWE